MVRVRERRAIVVTQDCKKRNKAATPLSVSILTEIMGSCGSKQTKNEAVGGPGSSDSAGSSSSKPNQKANVPAEGRSDQDDIDAVRYLRKQKESPTRVRRSAD